MVETPLVESLSKFAMFETVKLKNIASSRKTLMFNGLWKCSGKQLKGELSC